MSAESSLRRRGVIKRADVREGAPVADAAAAAGTAAEAGSERAARPEHTPRVRLLRLDEHTQAIELTCPCGETSLIEIQSETKP